MLDFLHHRPVVTLEGKAEGGGCAGVDPDGPPRGALMLSKETGPMAVG